MSVAADRNRLGGLTRADSISGPGSGGGNGATASDVKPGKTADPVFAEEVAAPTTANAAPALPRRRRRSSLTRRILTLNLLALAIPVAGLLYLDQYRNSLVQQQLDLMATEAELFSGALAASGVVTGPAGD
jgi:two-component system sensor histidine kinase ChvG